MGIYPYQYLRALRLPTILSPIPEEEEPAVIMRTVSPNESIGLNSLREVSSDNLFGPDGALSNQNQSAPRVVSSERTLIESQSGRRLNSVEVLKQKYLNDDIQDIPRLIQGPMRYGRLNRSRCHLNLGSQDIRAQLNKIRLKMGSTPFRDEGSKDEPPTFRCSKLKLDPSSATPGTFKSIRDLLYGTPNLDDYDPELAALFEDYVEDCDNPTRVTPISEHSLRDRCALGRNLIERVLNTETRYAFLSGFLEGMSQSDDAELKSFDQAIENKPPEPHETPKDPCIDQDSHLELIKSNQDVTHKFLKEWEQNNKMETPETVGCLACHQDKIIKRLSDTAITIDQSMSTGESDVTDNKTPKRRSTLHLGTIEFDIALPGESRSDSKLRDQLVTLGSQSGVSKRLPKLQKPALPDVALSPTLVGTKKAQLQEGESEFGKAGDATSTRESEDDQISPVHSGTLQTTKKLVYTQGSSHVGRCIIPGHNRFNAIKNKGSGNNSPHIFNASYISSPECRDSDNKKLPIFDSGVNDDISIIALAKQKLKHKLLTSTLLEEFFSKKQDKRQVESDVCRIKREIKDEPRPTSKSKAKAEYEYAIGDLEGWASPAGHLPDINISLSEILHPVGPTPTPVMLADQKDLKMVQEESDDEILTRLPTPTSAQLSDLNDNLCIKATYETTAFKHRSPLSNDFKKAASHVKLRLTKSCANMPNISGHQDKVFGNVPLSMCRNYYVKEKFKLSQKTTPHINLSEKLAHQLKTIGRDKGKKADVDIPAINSDTSLSRRLERIQPTSYSLVLPSIDKENIKEREMMFTPNGNKIVLPQISRSPNNANDTTDDKREGRDTDADPNTTEKRTSTDLPPLFVKSLKKYGPIPIKNTVYDSKRDVRNAYEFDEVETFPTGGFGVRAEVCTSPFQLDKADPNKIMVKAKSLPNQHTVCESCGGISEKITVAHEHGKSERHVQKVSEKVIHPQCYSPSNVTKWKLGRPHSDHAMQVPKLEVPTLNKCIRHEDPKTSSVLSQTDVHHTKNKKENNEEVTFKFMGQNIKLKFECELSVDSSTEGTPKKDMSSGCKRLQEISKPAFRDNFKNNLSRETGIYKKKKKLVDLSEGRVSMQSPGRDSAYVDYCKRKADMRSKKHLEMENDMAKLPTDDVVSKSKKKLYLKKVPVLPVKKAKTTKSTRLSTDKLLGPISEFHLTDKLSATLMIKPGHLPLLRAPSRTKASSGIQRRSSMETTPTVPAPSVAECL